MFVIKIIVHAAHRLKLAFVVICQTGSADIREAVLFRIVSIWNIRRADRRLKRLNHLRRFPVSVVVQNKRVPRERPVRRHVLMLKKRQPICIVVIIIRLDPVKLRKIIKPPRIVIIIGHRLTKPVRHRFQPIKLIIAINHFFIPRISDFCEIARLVILIRNRKTIRVRH